MFGRRRRSRAAGVVGYTPVIGEPVDVVALAAGDQPVPAEGRPHPGDVPIQGEPIVDGYGRVVNRPEGWTPGDRPMRPVAAEGRPTSPPPKPSDVRRGRRWWLRRTSAPRPEDRPPGPPPPAPPRPQGIPWPEGWHGQHVVTTACPRCGCPIGVVDASERKGSR